MPIPADAVGIGLKPEHYRQAIDNDHKLQFFEVHAENFMGAGGPPHRWLHSFREAAPLSVHGVCLSVGGREPLCADHLTRLAVLVDRYTPTLVSEHLAWSSDNGVFFNDLIAPPLTRSTLENVCDHVEQMQSRLRQTILIENPSRYLPNVEIDLVEPNFLNELSKRTGCGLLLDINNVFVSAFNLGFDAARYIDGIGADAVKEIHLAGHAIDRCGALEIRIDNHGAAVCDEVWRLYNRFIERAGPRPTLIEWDTNVPAFHTLAGEAKKARACMNDLAFPSSKSLPTEQLRHG